MVTCSRKEYDQERLSIPKTEYNGRIKKVQEEMSNRKLDIILTHSCECESASVRYLSNFWPVFDFAGVLIPREGEPILLTGGPESYDFAKQFSCIEDVRIHPLYVESNAPVWDKRVSTNDFTGLISEISNRIPVNRIGICNSNIIPYKIMEDLKKGAQEAELVNTDDLFTNIKAIKSQNEIALLKKAYYITEEAIKALKESGWLPCGDILIESVVDEEFAGANGTIASRMGGFNADFAINVEPTSLKLYPASVGALILKITVKGTAGMPYMGEEIYNPVYGIMKVLDILRDYEKHLNTYEPVHELWKSAQQKRSIIITKVKAGETKEHGQLGTPIDAWVEVIIQTYPGETEESSMSKFIEFFSSSIKDIPELVSNKPVIEKEYRYVEPGECPMGNEGIKALKASFESATGKEVKISGAPFSCDLAAFRKYGNTPAVLFGPCGGNLHAPDEWVDIESLITASKVYAFMIINWCGDK